MSISQARKSAFQILNRIETGNAYSSILLPHFQDKLKPKDAGLCHELTLGVLRNKLYLDECINKLIHKKPRRFDIEVRIALRLGLYQLYFLDRIPNYSAINESVNLVKAFGKRSASGLVNAVLRRASKSKPELSFDSEIEELSVMTSHPLWLIEKWAKDFGLRETKLLVKANNKQAGISFRFTAKSKMAGREKEKSIIEKVSIETEMDRSQIVEGCFGIRNSSPILRELVESGWIYFQDPGSQIVASLTNPAPGTRFLDACAAPGGKSTLILANEFEKNCEAEVGIHMIAGDLHHHRAREMKRSCKRQGAETIDLVVYDGVKGFPFAGKSFQTVLVDAPCSGTGTIRHNPEIRYTLEPTDFESLARKQLAILNNASKLVEPGGLLIYSTCSLEKEENEEVVETFLSSVTDFHRASIDAFDKYLTGDGEIRTFPHRDNIDGFYVSVLSRKA